MYPWMSWDPTGYNAENSRVLGVKLPNISGMKPFLETISTIVYPKRSIDIDIDLHGWLIFFIVNM